jgi:hypothetical protein
MLKLWVAFLPWFVDLTIIIEPLDGGPCSVCCYLTSLGVETRGKGVRFGKHSTGTLQVILGSVLIHPHAHALIANELPNPDRLCNGGELLLLPIHFVLGDQHVLAFASLLGYNATTQ